MGKGKQCIKRNIHVFFVVKRKLGPCNFDKFLYHQSLLLFDVEIMVILRKAEMWAGKVMTLRPGNL